MHLGENQLYVAATGYHFDRINTENEDRNLLLVYDREDRQPGDIDPDGRETLELAYFSSEDVLNKLAIPERIRSRIEHVVMHRDRVQFDPPTWSPPE